MRHLITGLAIGGAERTLAGLLGGLDRSRFDLSVACLRWGDKPVATEIRDMGFPVTDLCIERRLSPWSLVRILGDCAENRPHILHTWMFHANVSGRIAGRLTGVPAVVSSERTLGQESQKRYLLNRWTGRFADVHVCISSPVADFARTHIRLPAARIRVIRNGVPVPEPTTPELSRCLKEARGLPLDVPIVGTVAQFKKVKRLDVLVRASFEVPDAHFVLVGDGVERAAVEALAASLDVSERVHFVGEQRDPESWLRTFDVFALSSDWEGLSTATLEASALGLPVVVTDCGGISDAIRQEVTGLMVPRNRPELLARALNRLLADPTLRLSMGRSGRELMRERFSLNRMVREYADLYETLFEEHVNG